MNRKTPLLWLAAALCCSDGGSLKAADSSLDESIRQVRMGTLVIETAPGAEVRVEQLRHEFWFGAALANQMFSGRADERDGRQVQAGLPRKLQRGRDRERPQVAQHGAAAGRGGLRRSWTPSSPGPTEHEIPLRGHNVFWGVPNRVQPWLKTMDDDALRGDAQGPRAGRRAPLPRPVRRVRPEQRDAARQLLRAAPGHRTSPATWRRGCAQEDPQAVLYLNDYDILTGRRLEDYVVHIRKFLDQGVPIGGIGVQGHLHGDTFDPAALQNALDRLAEFKLPIRVTEFNFPGQRSKYYGKRGARLTDEEEQAKAKALADYYRICFAHPAVEGILMWGFWEGANWIPVSSLYRRDWSADPRRRRLPGPGLQTVVDDWRGQADAQGRCEVARLLRQTPGDCGRQGDRGASQTGAAGAASLAQVRAARRPRAGWRGQYGVRRLDAALRCGA